MPAIVRPSGIRVDASDGATAEGTVPLRRRRTGQLPPRDTGVQDSGGRRRRTAAPPAVPMTEEEALIDAIEAQELELVDAVPLGRTPAPPPGRRRTRTTPVGRPSPATVALDVPLRDGESAVVLLEQNGVYEWHVTGDEVAAPAAPAGPAASRRRRTSPQPEAQSGLPAPTTAMRFTLTLAPEPAPAAADTATRTRRRRGMVTKFLIGKAVAYVFRFIAKPIVSGLARFQERNVREGLVHITKPDPSAWVHLGESATLPLPTDRAARVLLLVHGTFSSTVGSFGALAGHADGASFLQSALAGYDLVIGWDHKTLSTTPTTNATDLITRLDTLGFTTPPTVDAIAFSRGGLVLRSLIEEILPNHPQALRIRRAVFVACTNDGTQLANPKHWNGFVDRYTNLAAAGARIASLIPAFTHGAMIFSEAVRGVGAFVKALVTAAKTGDGVPGLQAMDPDGPFVQFINQVQPGQPGVDDTYYCAITSDFDPDRASRTMDPEVLPPGVLLRIGDKAADALFGEPNDLVVHVASMTHIDPTVGQFVRDRHDFGRNGHVFHTTYFHQPETAQALTRWFDVAAAAPTVSASTRRGTKRATTAARTRPVRGGTSGRTPGPVPRPMRATVGNVPSDAIVIRSTMRTADALQRVTASHEPWIVIERPDRGRDGKAVVLHYAHRRDGALDMLRDPHLGTGATVHEAFNLRETKASKTVVNAPAPKPRRLDPGDAPALLRGSFGSRYRSVVIDAAKRVHVVPATEDMFALREANGGAAATAPDTTAETAPGTPRPTGGTRRGRKTATRPPQAVPGGAAPAASPPPPAPARGGGATRTKPAVDLHVRASTDDEYVLERTHVVAVTLSREALAALATGAQRAGKAKVAADDMLIVECLPMQRTSMANDADGRVEIPVPARGAPTELRFDVVARELGDALITVQVRQGPLPLVTLSLSVAVVGTRSGARRDVVGQADVASLPAMPAATNELRIVQLSPTNHSSQYRFELRLPGRKVRKEFVTTELTTDAESYVASVYRRIEDRWAEHGSEQAAFARDLRAIGSDLFDHLLPLELRQLLWKHRDVIESVQVVSSEPFIPWELVYLRDPSLRKPTKDAAFLGELGVVRWLMADYPPEKLTIRRRKARYVIPEYPAGHELPEADLEREMVEARFKATEVTSEAEAIYALLNEPGNFDLLHIACHGVADSSDIGSAHLEMPGKLRSDGSMSEEHLMADTVRREADLHDEAGGRQPIVVLNACQSARAGYGLKGIGGFAEAFVTGGAGVFIGSSWSVGDLPARVFIEEFYDQFLPERKTGTTLAKAVAQARQKARADGDATWLAYVVYGHPQAVATRVP